MNTQIEIHETEGYLRDLKAIGGTAALRAQIKDTIRKQPTKGQPLGSGLFKFRVAYRGGARIIHFHIEASIRDGIVGRNYLVTIFLKSVQPNLIPQELAALRQLAKDTRR